VGAPGRAVDTELRRGVLEHCVLAVLREGESFAFDIVRMLLGAGELVTSEGTIYPLLARLRRGRLVTTSWRESDLGPPRRSYRITDAGRRALEAFGGDWTRFRDAVDALLGDESGKGMQMDADALVHNYLDRLEAAAWRLALDRRTELVGEVREHIETALEEAGHRDGLTVRNILEGLGPPEEIIAAEGEPDAVPPAWAATPPTGPNVARAPWGAAAIVALLLLTVGAVLLPFVGPPLGLVFMWLSALWTRRQKLLASAIVLTLLVLPVLVLRYGQAATSVDAVSLLIPFGGIAAAIFLAVVLVRRRR
jgi:PadR family transcriptional regulator PadR